MSPLHYFCTGLVCLLAAQAQAQPLNPRWHGQWAAGGGATLNITDRAISTESIKGCHWRSAPDSSETECLSFYSGTVSKRELVELQNALVSLVEQPSTTAKRESRRKAESQIRQNKALLDRLGNETFKTVTVRTPAPPDVDTSDSEIFFFLNENTIYRVFSCEPCLHEGFSLTAFERTGAVISGDSGPGKAPSRPEAPQVISRDAPEGTGDSGRGEAPAYQAIEYTDFLLDHGKMTGQRVRIKASIQSLINSAVLRRDELDMNFIHVEMDALPRDDRKKLLTLCQHVTCAGIFYGQVKKKMLGPSIQLERVEWQGAARLMEKLRN